MLNNRIFFFFFTYYLKLKTRYKLIFIHAPQLPQINMVRVCNRAGGEWGGQGGVTVSVTVTLPFVCDFTFMTTARLGQIPKDRL